MQVPADSQIKLMGKEVLPYERLHFVHTDLESEAILFDAYVFDATECGKPKNLIEVNPRFLETDRKTGK